MQVLTGVALVDGEGVRGRGRVGRGVARVLDVGAGSML
jgi:hypothetical protein